MSMVVQGESKGRNALREWEWPALVVSPTVEPPPGFGHDHSSGLPVHASCACGLRSESNRAALAVFASSTLPPVQRVRRTQTSGESIVSLLPDPAALCGGLDGVIAAVPDPSL